MAISVAPSRHRLRLVLIAALAAQLVLAWRQSTQLPDWEILGPAPSQALVRAVSFGDNQAAYYMLGLYLQHAQDPARFATPLTEYNYDRVIAWLELMDRLDPKAHFAPYIGAYLFGASPDPEQVRQIVGYLRESFRTAPTERWFFMAHAVFLARHRVKDLELAIAVADELAESPAEGIPLWARQLRAFVLAQLGETEAAIAVTREVLRSAGPDDLRPGERRYMEFFIERMEAQRMLEDDMADETGASPP